MQRDWYDTPLYYDIIFDADTPKDGTFLEAAYETYSQGRGSKRVLEPACGSGRLLSEMAWRGWKVAGFDLSQPMLDYADERLAQQGLKATLWQDRMESFAKTKPGTFDLAHCLVSTFKYLLTEAHAAAHLRLVAEALRPGGIYVLGIHLTDYARTSCEHERWVAERDKVHVVCNTRDWPADSKTRLEDVRNRLSITNKDGKKHVQETHWQFRTYSAKQMKALLRKAPAFELVACHDFTHDITATRELDDSYPDVVMVLRKRMPTDTVE
ncbi:MAG: Methyltransferase type 11 [Verrucomicrobiaceae bacterium]|nr:Methyltransferase type 11 [Verrucomicrobiaceae bacterium]